MKGSEIDSAAVVQGPKLEGKPSGHLQLPAKPVDPEKEDLEAVTKEEQQTQRYAHDMWGEEVLANWAAAPPTPRAAEQEERTDDEDEREESKAEGQNKDNDKTDEKAKGDTDEIEIEKPAQSRSAHILPKPPACKNKASENAESKVEYENGINPVDHKEKYKQKETTKP